jgi:excinuclease ABC subunit B
MVLSEARRTVEGMRQVTDLQRTVAPFRVVADFEPSGDQPAAIDDLERRIKGGEQDVVLLGATGTGKTATVAWLAERIQRPVLVLQPNKTLAAQFANELRQFFPQNSVEYFVSYYDYYQPEAYVPQTDTYIEKDSSINDEVERLRHSATWSLLTRRDVIVVATVSCIYGLGSADEYLDRMVHVKVGEDMDRDDILRRLVQVQYSRNDLAGTRGTFRVRGDTLEVFPVYQELAVRVEFFGDEIERLMTLHPVTGEILSEEDELYIGAATHYVTNPNRMERAIHNIEEELAERLAELERHGQLLEAQRLRMRTTYDIEMMRQIGTCSGIENYSRHLDGRPAGSAPHCLLDYFPEDFLMVIDESHVTVPQVGGMYEGDMSRKRTLVDHGFRLPSAMDNRPLKWEEFLERIGQTVYLSATPGQYELDKSDGHVEQIIRPTGLVDPEVIVKPTKGQIDDLIHEIRLRTERNERVLVTTLTKKMSEDLTDYLLEMGIRTRYLHSEVDTLRRVELLRELRQGEYDVLVGINLLREGLDLPEVSLVAILDADKEGFLRSGRSLIQTIGRAARNVSGAVIMYADTVTPSMEQAIDETNRRRAIQVAYNTEHGIDPTPLRKRIADITDMLAREDADTADLLGSGRSQSRGKAPVPGALVQRRFTAEKAGEHARQIAGGLPSNDLADLIQQLTDQMHNAAAELQFEVAARLRDEISELKKELRQMVNAGAR